MWAEGLGPGQEVAKEIGRIFFLTVCKRIASTSLHVSNDFIESLGSDWAVHMLLKLLLNLQELLLSHRFLDLCLFRLLGHGLWSALLFEVFLQLLNVLADLAIYRSLA